jgi:hypothetical protein
MKTVAASCANLRDVERCVIEVVTSPVAQRSRSFDNVRRNYAVLTFEPAALHVELRSLKVGGRFDFTAPVSPWSLP